MQSNPYHNQPEIESSSTGPWRSGCGCALAILTGIIVLFLVPAIQRNFGTREAARRTQCKSHLKHIVIALHNYHDVYGGFPPAFTVDADGKPLHSWRTLILPFIEQQALYDQIDLSVPWDHPTNAAMHETNIATYQCPSAGLAAGYTTYRAIVGDDKGLHPTDRRPISEFNDGDGP